MSLPIFTCIKVHGKTYDVRDNFQKFQFLADLIYYVFVAYLKLAQSTYYGIAWVESSTLILALKQTIVILKG